MSEQRAVTNIGNTRPRRQYPRAFLFSVTRQRLAPEDRIQKQSANGEDRLTVHEALEVEGTTDTYPGDVGVWTYGHTC